IVAKNAELWKRACTAEEATHPPGVPRAVVRRALEDALAKDSNTTLGSVAASLGLRSTRRFYREKPLSDLAHAIAAKNAELWKRVYLTTTQTECRAQSIRKIEQQVGHGSNLITKGLSAEPALPSDSLAFRLACRQAYRLNDAHKELEAALLEDPAPAFSTVLKRL